MTSESIIPRPRTLEPAPTLRWGVIGPGSIAARFVHALRSHGTQQVVAVGSRAAERATAFAARQQIAGTAGSVDQILDLTEVDVIYIATPHDSHRELAERALDAGKHVVIEKPFAMTAADAAAITTAARNGGRFAMEAMWTRYLPQAHVLRRLLDEHAIGEVTYVGADFGFVAPYDPAHRLFNPALGGGALLDAGVYPVSFIASVLGPPSEVIAAGTLAATGVDDHAQLTLPYGTAVAAATTSLRSALPVRAIVAGTAGRIEIEPPFIHPSSVTLSTSAAWGPDHDAVRWVDDALADPYDALHYEADAAARFITEGRLESPWHDHAETIAVISVLERARQQLGAR